MLAIGIMSGTSLDGVDCSLVRIKNVFGKVRYDQIDFVCIPYEESFKQKILEASSLSSSNVQLICSLNVEVSKKYCDAVKKILENNNLSSKSINFIAMHGQTIWHNPNNKDGFESSTLQIGDPSILAYEFNTRVISNFRMMDMAAGGCGAPLIPMVDYIYFRALKCNVACQNIGGIGNVCFVPKNHKKQDVIAFDTGVGNMLIDLAMRKLYNQPYDCDGKIALSGVAHECLVDKWINEDTYLTDPLPKSTGRERYNDDYLNKMLEDAKGLPNEDIIASITCFTADSIVLEYKKFLPTLDVVLLSGGGSNNPAIVNRLVEKLEYPVYIDTNSDSFEAFGFAILGYYTLKKRPANICQVTNAKSEVVLGNITNKPRKD